MVTQLVLVTGWKVPVDAAADIVAFGFHADGFGNRQIPVLTDGNMGTVVENALFGGSQQRQAAGEQDEPVRQPEDHDFGMSICGAAR